VPIEEHEVRARGPVDGLVYAKKVLDRRAGAAFGAWIERSDADFADGLVFGTTPACRGSASRRRSLCTPSFRGLPRLGRWPRSSTDFPRPGLTRLRELTSGTVRRRPLIAGRPARTVPPLLDFRHATTDNELQM